MKKLLVVVLTAIALVVVPLKVCAAQGSWSSSWGYGANGISIIGATNAMNSSYWHQFQVRGAGNKVLSHSNKQIGAHKKYITTHRSAPMREKQGRIFASPQVYFTPHFNH